MDMLVPTLEDQHCQNNRTKVLKTFECSKMAATLKNGYKMLIIRLGIWRMDSKDIKTVLIHAIKLGYRHFNCAGTLTPSYCNCGILLTRDCLAYAKVKPAVNQIELHPYLQCESLVNFCQKHGICVTAHTPLGGALGLAEKYKKTVAQIIL
ncbi:unnamed protein product [Camellia sinensis]